MNGLGPRTRRVLVGVAILAAGALAGCGGSTDSDSGSASPSAEAVANAPGSAVENTNQPAVWLTVVNNTGESLPIDMTTNCDDNDVRTLSVGEQWDGTGTCGRSADVKGTIRGLAIYATASGLSYGACQWRRDGDAVAEPYLTTNGQSSSGCTEFSPVVGDQPVNDSRFHWTITINPV